jgi:DsbC/DsbD-like thiol-disulfide interchange protein
MNGGLIILSLLVVNTASGQTVEGKIIVRPELVTEARDFSKPFEVGIHFQLEPGWYLYWKNPGDGGLPIEVQWELPPGWKAGPLTYPVPEKFVHGDIISYGYKGSVLLPVTLTPPDGLGPESTPLITARLDWLVCKESCLRGKGTVTLARYDDEKRIAVLFDRTRRQLPEPLEASGISIQSPEVLPTSGAGHIVRFRLTGKNASLVTDFFPEALENATIDYKSIAVNNATISLIVTPNSDNTPIDNISGLLVQKDRAYQCVIPLKRKP